MSFCQFSTESIKENFVKLENSFIKEFMPNAPENCVKVYLFGLYLCNNTNSLDNDIANFSRAISLSEEDIVSSFLYWQELGLVTVLNTNPIEVRYLPVKNGSLHLKKYNVDKYKSFNIKAQEILNGRVLTPSEFNEYYYTIESLKIEPDALLMIMQYCANLKGKNISQAYILTIAKNWAYEGILTCEQIEERLKEQQCADSAVKDVLKAMGSKRKPTIDEYEMFISWTNTLGFTLDTIMFLAKKCKGATTGINKLNALINKFYELSKFSIKEIEDYLQQEQTLFETAKQVCRNLGIRYDNLEIVVETYINSWVGFGYSEDTLIKIARFCFISNIRSLEGMNTKVNQFYKLGLVSFESIENQINSTIKNDENIKEILNELGIIRLVNKLDRNMYSTWLNDWNISNELLQYAIEESKNKFNPMQNVNKMLAYFHTNNITNLEKAKTIQFENNTNKKPANKKSFESREYTKEDISSLFDSLQEVDV